MPFQQADEHSRKNGSTHSSFDVAPSPTGPTRRSFGTVAVDLDRARLVAAQAEAVPVRGVGLDLVAQDEEAGEVGVVAVEVRGWWSARCTSRRSRPRWSTTPSCAPSSRPGHLLGAGRDRVPEMRAGLGIGIGERADQAILVDAPHDVLDRRAVVMAEQRRGHRAQVHGVAHGRRRAAVAGDGLDRHGGADMVLRPCRRGSWAPADREGRAWPGSGNSCADRGASCRSRRRWRASRFRRAR